MRNIRRLLRDARPYRRVLALAVFAAVMVSVATAAQPLIVRAVIDSGIVARKMSTVVGLCGLLLVAGGVQAAGFSARRRLMARVGYGFEADLRQRFFVKVTSLDEAFHGRMSTGQLMSRGSADLMAVSQFISSIAFFFTLVLQLGFALTVMVRLDWQLSLVALAVVPPTLFTAQQFSRRLDPIIARLQEALGRFATVVEETVTGIRVVKAFGRERHLIDKAGAAADGVYDTAVESIRLQARFIPFFSVLPQLAFAALIWYGGRRVLDGHLTLGTLIAFNAYLALMLFPLHSIGWLVSSAQRAATASGRIYEVLDERVTIDDPDAPQPLGDVRGEIRFEHVSFSYRDGHPVLEDVTLDIPSSTSLALVGPTGCGKSTLMRLIPRLLDPTSGRVLLDGTDVRSLRVDELRTHVGAVLEDAMLFSEPVGANVAFGRPGAPIEDVERAASIARAHDFVLRLDHGYDTVVGEQGLSLSGGQRQRIALARALLVRPSILLLDDATSSIDPRVEAEIRAGLDAAMQGRTTVIVARRRSAAAMADRVAFMRDGRIVAVGTHDELWETNAEYRDVLSPEDLVEPDLPTGGTLSAAPIADEVESREGGDGAAEEERTPLGRRELRLLWNTVRPHAKGAVAALALLLVSQGAALAGPTFMRMGIDDGIARGSVDALNRAAVLMVGAAFVVALAIRWSQMLAGRAGERALRDLRLRAFEHLVGLDVAYFERERTGAIVSRLTADLQVMETLVTQSFIQMGASSVYLMGSILVLLALDLTLAAVALAVVLPAITVASIWFRTRSARVYARVRVHVAGVMIAMQETFSGVRVVQAFAQRRRREREFSDVNDAWRVANIESWSVAAKYFPIVELIGVAGTVTVLAVGAQRYFGNRATLGVLAAFVVYLASALEPVHALSELFDQFQAATSGLARVARLMDEKPRVTDSPTSEPLDGVLGRQALSRVDFRYGPDLPPALCDVVLDVPAGEVIALVGQSGAGKSSIAKLLLRFYDPVAGVVRLDDRSLRQVSLATLRMHIAFVPQEGFLFAGTVRDNIRFARPEASDDEVREVCRSLEVDELIARLPDGYDTEVGEHSSALSGGQRQLIALARAVLARPKVLVLDEATSALDPGTEARLQRALRRATAGRTTILIAHRLSTARRADRIAVVHEGRIAELGTHDELIARPEGIYASLYAHWLAAV